MQLELRHTWRKALLLAVCALISGAFGYLVIRRAIAAHAALTYEPESLQKAIALEPGSAEYHALLARYYAIQAQDAAAALPYCQAAVARNPHKARYWLDLAGTYAILGDEDQRRAALQAAKAAEPFTPDVAWEAGNYHLVNGELEQALEEFRLVLRGDPNQTFATLDVCWRATQDIDLILNRLLPPDINAHLALLSVLTRREETEAAQKVWTHAFGLKQEPPSKPVLDYIDYLIGQDQTDLAGSVWSDLLALSPRMASYAGLDNMVVNGGFEHDVLNAAFDWRLRDFPNATLESDTSDFHGGNRSLAITYNGMSGSDSGLQQIVPVHPNTRYVFSGWMKALEIYSTSGPRFFIHDGTGRISYLLTDDVLGSEFWKERKGEFTTGPETQFVVISVARIPADTAIKGKIWVDDISLRPAQ